MPPDIRNAYLSVNKVRSQAAGVEVRVQVCGCLREDVPPREVGCQLAQGNVAGLNLCVAAEALLPLGVSIGNGQGAELAGRQNRAGETAVGGVEAFAAEDELHRAPLCSVSNILKESSGYASSEGLNLTSETAVCPMTHSGRSGHMYRLKIRARQAVCATLAPQEH